MSLDSADRAQFLKAWVWFGGPCFVILTAAEIKLAVVNRLIPPWMFLLLLPLNVLATYVGARIIVRLTESGATAFSRIVLATDGLPHGPAFSAEESLVARGFYREAAEQYRGYLATHPAEVEAHIRLAELYRDHLDDPAAAEQCYLRARRFPLTLRQENTIANGLIDLYRKVGRRDRMKVELARFAARYQGTRPGDEAARLLREMKAEDAPESRSSG
jgi:hypothetical protein